jgi:acetylornithine deacetylase/succinyl-diaminopimelate desuccinylase-like protein
MMRDVTQQIEQDRDLYVDQLKELLRIPTVSGDSAYAAQLEAGAEFVRKQLVDAGLEAEVIPTAGHPLVFGSWLHAERAPTVLVYGHYDVQPPDPLDEWHTPPFEPDIRDGHIYARGATDDKGQMLTHVKSVEAWMKAHGRLPVNVKFVIEGEEEVGSKNLDVFLEENHDKAACDIAVISDTSQFAPGIPAITYGLRGVMACEVTLRGPAQDLHSGMFGGSVTNPANALAGLIGRLHDEQGRVCIPGFYDDVVPLSDQERARFADLPFEESAFFQTLGLSAGSGEAGFSTIERRWARPTCDVNGLLSGYTGEGPKTIVPAWAMAKITCRLVPHQDSQSLTSALGRFLEKHLPPGLTMDFVESHGCTPLVFDADSEFMQAAHRAIEKAFGVRPVMIREGASIPVVATFRDVLGVDTLLLGWGQNTDNLHSPNERFSLADFHRGIHASAHLWQELAEG